MGDKGHQLGDLGTSEHLIKDLYIDLRKRVNEWAEITKQTAQARMGYIGQHLVSVVTGFPGGKSGARGRDLILPNGEFAEIKTCYRVDQLSRCNACGAVIASIEQSCPSCGATDIRRNEDSKWLIGIRNDAEFEEILNPVYYYLALFDFVDVNDPNTIRASIWKVDSSSPGFAYCMVDYYLNIRAKSLSKAPFNLWPYQLKFDLMKPKLIYRSLIKADDIIHTEVFPGRDKAQFGNLKPLPEYSGSLNLTMGKIVDLGRALGITLDSTKTKKKDALNVVQKEIDKRHLPEPTIADLVSFFLYYSDISEASLPDKLRSKLDSITAKIQTVLKAL